MQCGSDIPDRVAEHSMVHLACHFPHSLFFFGTFTQAYGVIAKFLCICRIFAQDMPKKIVHVAIITLPSICRKE